MVAIHDAPSTDPIFRLPPDYVMQEVVTPLSEVYDWTFNLYGVPELWKENGGSINDVPITICVCDTGVDHKHPDLQGQILDAVDFTNSFIGEMDMAQHGTWCCGMLVAKAGNDQGVAGIANKARVVSCKVLGDNGAGSERSIMQGMKYGRDKHNAKFFSLSLGGGQMSEQMHGFFNELAQEGRFIFCAAGNDSGPVNYPAKWWEACVPVGSADKKGNLSRFTSRGPELLKGVVGPGENMISTTPNGTYKTMSGTSMATPFTCGIAALAYGKHQTIGGSSKLTNIEEMRLQLQRSSGKAGEYCLINPKEIFAGIHGQVPPIEDEQAPTFELFGAGFYMPGRKGDWMSINITDEAVRAKILQAIGR